MSERIDILPYWYAIVVPTVNDVHRRFGQYVDREDLQQEAALWWYQPEAQKYLAEYLSEDGNFVRLRRSIWRHCASYAGKEKAAKVGYFPDDQVQYRTPEILKLLPVALAGEHVEFVAASSGESSDLNAGIHSQGNKAESTNNVLVALLDVRNAIKALRQEDRLFLRNADAAQLDWAVLAPEYDVEPDSLRRKHNRIVERMARFLNNDIEENAA